MQNIITNLWFDHEAEEAARFYTGIFPDSKIERVSYYGDAGPMPKGTVLTVGFTILGMNFIALNGGPEFKFTPAVSFMVNCASQQEVDYYWDKLTEGGREDQCGWLQDKYGLSWQIVPEILDKLLNDPHEARANRVMEAMLKMRKIEIAPLLDVYQDQNV